MIFIEICSKLGGHWMILGTHYSKLVVAQCLTLEIKCLIKLHKYLMHAD
jgi:hypothetical protein